MDRIEFDYNCSYNRRHSYAEKIRGKVNTRDVSRRGYAEAVASYRGERSNRVDMRSDIISKSGMRIKKQLSDVKLGLHDSEFINRNVLKAEKWLEIDDKDLRVEGARAKLPSGFLAAIVAVATSLMLVVAGAVISSKAKTELYAAENHLKQLQIACAELESELEIKNDLLYIEDIARNKLGMIDKEHGTVLKVGDKTENKVEVYKQESSDASFSGLLNALGFLGE